MVTATCRYQNSADLWTKLTQSPQIHLFSLLNTNSSAKISKMAINDRLASRILRSDRNGDGALKIEDHKSWCWFRHNDEDFGKNKKV